jgi:hypothetical protein
MAVMCLSFQGWVSEGAVAGPARRPASKASSSAARMAQTATSWKSSRSQLRVSSVSRWNWRWAISRSWASRAAVGSAGLRRAPWSVLPAVFGVGGPRAGFLAHHLLGLGHLDHPVAWLIRPDITSSITQFTRSCAGLVWLRHPSLIELCPILSCARMALSDPCPVWRCTRFLGSESLYPGV